MKNIWLEGIMGVVVGDALGMPVQFLDREALKEHPIKKMEGNGTYNMPVGTWSDDSSMTLATLVSLQKEKKVDYQDIMERFLEWELQGAYTPHGKAFDQGITCIQAIVSYSKEPNYRTCGRTGEWANGNGALMRIMPVCLWAYEKVTAGEWDNKQAIAHIHQVAALTHNHLRSHIACGMYYFMVKSILEREGSLRECLQAGIDDTMEFYRADIRNLIELSYYARLVDLEDFKNCPEEEIKSSGYVVDTLEAVVWSLINTSSLEAGLLKAVNLGSDTDTVGAIAGGLAALYYGYEGIPKEWLEVIVKRDWIESLCK